MASLSADVRVRRARRAPPAPQAATAASAGPDPLLVALALMTWTYVWRVQDLFPILGALQLSLVSAAVVIGLFVLDRDPARRLRRLRTPVLTGALVLSMLATFGIPTSLWPGNSAMFLLTGFLPNIVLMVLLAASVRGMRDLRWITLVYVVGALVHAVFVFLTFGVRSDGRLSDLVYYDANDLALVVVCTIPLVLFLLVTGSWRVRLVAVAAAALLMVILVKTGSRGGFLGLVAVVLYVLFRYRAIPRRVRLLVVGGGAAILSLAAGDAYWANIRTLGSPQQDYNWSGRAPEGRMEVWRRGLGYMAAHPVFGVGLKNFPTAEGLLSAESRSRAERGAGFKWSAAHNSFLEVGVELGVLGLVCFAGMFAAALRALGRVRAEPIAGDAAALRRVALACSLTASLVGFMVSGFLVSAAYYSALYVLFGLAMALAKLNRLERARPGALPAEWERLLLTAAGRSRIGDRRAPAPRWPGGRPSRGAPMGGAGGR